jgi:hypothetical protein
MLMNSKRLGGVRMLVMPIYAADTCDTQAHDTARGQGHGLLHRTMHAGNATEFCN